MDREFVIGGRRALPSWLAIFVPGCALVGFGVLIILLPELLVALVAVICITLGLVMASLGWRLRAMSRQMNMPPQ